MLNRDKVSKFQGGFHILETMGEGG